MAAAPNASNATGVQAFLKEQGINVGLVRPITVWPFPYDAVKKLPSFRA